VRRLQREGRSSNRRGGEALSAGEIPISAGEEELHCCGQQQQRRREQQREQQRQPPQAEQRAAP
jgi:hypothetical protein